MVRHDEEARRIGKRLVLRVPARIGMAVGRDDRQIAHRIVEAPRHGAGRGIGGQQPVLVNEHFGAPLRPSSGPRRRTVAAAADIPQRQSVPVRAPRRRVGLVWKFCFRKPRRGARAFVAWTSPSPSTSPRRSRSPGRSPAPFATPSSRCGSGPAKCSPSRTSRHGSGSAGSRCARPSSSSARPA